MTGLRARIVPGFLFYLDRLLVRLPDYGDL